MNEKTVKLIRKYAGLRFFENPKEMYEVLKDTYEGSRPERQIQYKKEMNLYLEAIEQGTIVKGDRLPTVRKEDANV